jgi:enamine deaminase RidA (YjgF/YER057c/UK114 family)
MKMETITLPSAKALGLPFSSAVRAGDFLYLSGAIGNKPGTMTLVEGGLLALDAEGEVECVAHWPREG